MIVILMDDDGMCHNDFKSGREDDEVDESINRVAMWYVEVGSSE